MSDVETQGIKYINSFTNIYSILESDVREQGIKYINSFTYIYSRLVSDVGVTNSFTYIYRIDKIHKQLYLYTVDWSLMLENKE